MLKWEKKRIYRGGGSGARKKARKVRCQISVKRKERRKRVEKHPAWMEYVKGGGGVERTSSSQEKKGVWSEMKVQGVNPYGGGQQTSPWPLRGAPE